ncbi:MAG: hypothetical protein AAB316_05225 [Bacteroidota bacterium]
MSETGNALGKQGFRRGLGLNAPKIGRFYFQGKSRFPTHVCTSASPHVCKSLLSSSQKTYASHARMHVRTSLLSSSQKTYLV